jgi:hypothetical protein
MRRSIIAALGVVALVMSIAVSAVASSRVRTFPTPLFGSEEAPGPGDSDATGSATIEVGPPGQRELCFDLSWADIDGTVTDAHVHEAPFGSPGPVVVPLFVGQSFASTGTLSGCVEADTATLAGIRGQPTGYYVNVHSTVFPAGAIRGQLGD